MISPAPHRAARYTRQTRLREFGDAGQARVASSTATVESEALAAEIEARYLAGAGFGELQVRDAATALAARAARPDVSVKVDASIPAHVRPLPFDIRDAAAGAVAEGAYRALVAIRAALGIDGRSARDAVTKGEGTT